MFSVLSLWSSLKYCTKTAIKSLDTKPLGWRERRNESYEHSNPAIETKVGLQRWEEKIIDELYIEIKLMWNKRGDMGCVALRWVILNWINVLWTNILDIWKFHFISQLDFDRGVNMSWGDSCPLLWLLKRRENVIYTIKRWRILKRLNVLPKSRKTTFMTFKRSF